MGLSKLEVWEVYFFLLHSEELHHPFSINLFLFEAIVVMEKEKEIGMMMAEKYYLC